MTAVTAATAETLWHKLLSEDRIRSQPGLYYEPEDRHWFRQMDFGPVADCAVLYTRTFEKIDVTKYTPIFDGYLGAGNRGILLGIAREAWGDPFGWVARDCVNGIWQFFIGEEGHWRKVGEGPTEAIAILRAIEVATLEATP